MAKAKSLLLSSLVLLLLVCAQVSAQCEGTIAFRTEEGKFGIVAVKIDGALASPEYFSLPQCSNAIHARGDQFCCATLDEISLWCFDWTLGNPLANFKSWSLPPLPNVTLQWPLNKLSINTPENPSHPEDLHVATFSETAASVSQPEAPRFVSAVYVYKRDETSLTTLREYSTAGPSDVTFIPAADDALRWTTYLFETFPLVTTPAPVMMGFTWSDGTNDVIADSEDTFYTFERLLERRIVPTKSHVFSFNKTSNFSPIYRAPFNLGIPDAPLEVYNTSSTTNWINIASTDAANCDFLIASIKSASGASSTRLAWAPINNTEPIYFTSNMRYTAIDMVFSPIYPSNFIPCSGPSPDPEFFHCVNGSWIAPTSIYIKDYTITGALFINGSFSVGNSVVFSGPSSTLTVSGCIQINGSIVLTLSSDDIDKIIKGTTTTGELFRSENCNLGNLNNKEVKLNQKGKKRCEKITATTKTTTDGKGLVAVMKIDKKDCNLWWIILVSVLCGLILITIIILVLVFTLNKKAKNCIRPYAKRRETRPKAQ